MAVLTKALTRLRADFNTAFPGRDKASDGWVGDLAHQKSTSGHNPDDTAGARAEYGDSDSRAEVRAIDVDRDLRGPVSLATVVERIIATPADARRLRYVIYNGRIASKSAGWAWRPYSGANPHDKHAHFSGDPEFDDDDRPWVVAQMGADMPLTDADVQKIVNALQARVPTWVWSKKFNNDPKRPSAETILANLHQQASGENGGQFPTWLSTRQAGLVAEHLTAIQQALLELKAASGGAEVDYDRLGDVIAGKLFERAIRGGQ